jgi:hypothetical protein
VRRLASWPTAVYTAVIGHYRFARILLKKSEIEVPRKTRFRAECCLHG